MPFVEYPAKRQSARYKIFIYSRRCEKHGMPITSAKSGVVEAWMPSSGFSENITSEWGESAFLSAAKQKFAGALNIAKYVSEGANQLFAKSLSFKQFSRQVWKSNSPLNLTLDLEFLSDDYVREGTKAVYERCQMLELMASPDEESGGRLNPPGPALARTGVTGNSDYISIIIGGTNPSDAFRVLDNCIIKSVDVNWKADFDPEGYPHQATASIAIMTQDVWTWKDIGTFRTIQLTGEEIAQKNKEALDYPLSS